MNMTLKKSLLGAGFAALALLTLSTVAWSMGPGGGFEHDPGRMIAHMSERLDLSEEQRVELEALLAAAGEESAADRQRLQQLREQLRKSQQDFDPVAAQAMADEIGEITARLVFQAASTQAQVYRMLTPEQQQQMEELKAMRGERRGKWRRDGGPRGE